MVLDSTRVDDRSFTASAWQGMTDAAATGGVAISYSTSRNARDFAPNLASAAGRCDTTVAVGGAMTAAVRGVASAHRTSSFALVDGTTRQSNVYGIQFDTAQSAFLAGYLAAAMSRTGVVGTFGGVRIPGVTAYMDGFAEGVRWFDQRKHAAVRLRGWDEARQQGLFTGSFDDRAGGAALARQLIGARADVIMPVAAGAGLGAVDAARPKQGAVRIVWVDADGCTVDPQDCPLFLTSVVKDIPRVVSIYLQQAERAGAASGSYVGTLADGGTRLAPFHDFEAQVPVEVKSDLQQIEKDILAGTIAIRSPSRPKP